MARRPRVLELSAIGALDRQGGPLARQLVHALREAVRAGDLRPGEPLPATRQLAAALRMARSTVVEAYAQLVSEGVLQSQPRSATRVSQTLQLPTLQLPTRQAPAPRGRRASHGRQALSADPPLDLPVDPPPDLPAPAQAFARLAQEFQPLPAAPFAVSSPQGRTRPDDAWRRLGNRLRARGDAAPSGYGDPMGVRALREAVAEHVRRSRSVRCTADQVIITSGIQQGLHICCQLLLGPGDAAWVEDPAYRGITAILEHAVRQVRMVRVPVDGEGLDVAQGMALDAQARAAFVTPSHQYPLGMPLSMARRNALLDWARTRNAWIVEDDYDSELRYAGHPFPSLQGMAPGRVIYLGTFSKILFPSLRLGYAIVPEGMQQAFCGARVLMDRHPPGADQHVLAAFMEEGHLQRHVRRVRHVYAERRLQLMEMVQRLIPSDRAWLQPSDQGMHLLLWLAEGLDDCALASRALCEGIAVRPVSPLFSQALRRPGLILGLGDFEDGRQQQALRQLARLLAQG